MNPATANALSQAACGEHRSIGSSLKFCLLAEGEADFYPRLGPTMEWDTAAGDAVLRAGGGAVVTLEGTPLRYGKVGVARNASFENPYFLAAGDPTLLERLDLAALAAHAGMSVTPLVLTTKGLDDYALLDSGHGRKLERFGALTLDRPEEQAIWTPRLSAAEWEKADAIFTGDVDEEGAGRWKRRAGLGGILDLPARQRSASPAASPPSAMSARFPSRRRTGRSCASGSALAGGTTRPSSTSSATPVSPPWSRRRSAPRSRTSTPRRRRSPGRARTRRSRSSRTSRSAGSSTTRQNSRRARCGADGAMTASCSIRRNSGAGRRTRCGTSSRTFRRCCGSAASLLKPGGFLILTAYAIRASFLSLHRLSEEVLGPGVESGELALQDQGGGLLATSLFSRWSARR